MIDMSFLTNHLSNSLLTVVEKIQNQERISDDEALILFNEASLPLLGSGRKRYCV